MSVREKLPPWNWQARMVDPATGTATPEFLRWLQQARGNDDWNAGELGTKVDKTTEIVAGFGLSGGGNLSADVTLDLDANLGDLNDVDFTVPPTDGQILRYDGTAGKWEPGTGGGGSSTLIGITQLMLPADFTVLTGAWRLPTTWSEERDTLSAYTAGDTFVTVPTGTTLVKASAMVSWSNGDSLRAIVVSDNNTFPATGNHLLHNVNGGSALATLSSIEGPYIPVTAGTPFYIGFNSFFADANLSGASGTNFGRPTRIAFEWYSDWPM